MINIEVEPIFRNHKDSLEHMSYDFTRQESVTTSQKIGINFDDVKTEYTNTLGLSEEVAASVDSIVLFTSNIAFVEFKNGKVHAKDIKDKIRDSLLIFEDIVKKNNDYTRENLEFVLVYNEDENPLPNQYTKEISCGKSSRLKISKSLLQLGSKEIILFDIEKYKTLYFKDVHTYTKEEFENREKDIISLIKN